MKTLRVPFGLFLLTVGLAWAQQPASAGAAPGAPPAASPMRSAAELEQLLGPIALYPDALIALILPASTAPADIVLAARHVQDFPNDLSQVEHRAWDESVKSLAHYPDVLKWMDGNLHWTKQLGEVFVLQPADVMQAVQRLRAKARAAGTLVDTPQQQVIAEPQVIRIVPTQPDVIYVPQYQPEVVFVDRPVYYAQPFITFGIGARVGSWLAYDCDWRHHTIWVGNRHRHWSGHDWRRPVVPFGPSHGHTHTSVVRSWRPPPQPPRPSFSVAWNRPLEVARPSAFGATATRSYSPRGSSSGSYEHRRGESTRTQPITNPQPRTYSGTRRDLPAPNNPPSTTQPGIALPPMPAARIHAPTPLPAAPVVTNPAPVVTNSVPASNRSSNHHGWSQQNRDTRTRTSTAPAVPAAPPAPSVTVAPPASTRSGHSNGWSHARNTPTHTSQSPTVHSAPAARSAPSAHRSQPATIAAPPAVAAPRVLHSRSVPTMVHSSPAPAVTSAPVAAAPAPAVAAPAAPRVDTGERRHGRRSEN